MEEQPPGGNERDGERSDGDAAAGCGLASDEPQTVRTVQFNIILNEPPVIIFQMRVNTYLPESVPRITPHLDTRITDTSFA